jgi:hypothetical protein
MGKDKQRAKRGAKPVIEEMTGEQFDALPDAEKERIYQEIDSMTPEQWEAQCRPPNAAERARLEATAARFKRNSAARRKAARTNGAREKEAEVAVTMPQRFLNRVDAYARKHAMERGEMITRGLRLVMGERLADPIVTFRKRD